MSFSKLKKLTINFMQNIANLIPKKKKLWLFGAWKGELYADNTKYFYEYIEKNQPEVDAVWITKSTSVLKELRNNNKKVYKRFSFKGIWYAFRAEAAFATEGESDISPFMSGTKIFQLWHGMGIKAVGLESGWVNHSFYGEIEERKKHYQRHHAKWTWLCASEEAKRKYSRAFEVPKEQFFITGQAKDDTFVNCKSNPYIESLRESHREAKIIVYLPTHRNFGKEDNIADVMSIENLAYVNKKLADNNIIMIFKPHFHEFSKYEGFEKKFSNIVFAIDKNKFGDVYEFLPCCDLMITDYSGIMFGYLASGKPIIYFAYDYDEYVSDDAGFCYDYNEIVYGPICKTWDEVIDKAARITSEDYAELREKQSKRFCPYHDGKSCERIYHQVVEILGKK